jgi:AmmeMemoRadiSam system protein B/AmmeMemoRadiSam system protein A
MKILSIIILLTITGCSSKAHQELQERKEELIVRKSAVAGSFYPSNTNVLIQQVDSLLKAHTKGNFGHIVGLIAPHAGYMYSGRVAGAVYKQIEKIPYKTVVIIGPAHHFFKEGIFIDSSDVYETPLGRIFIDKKLAKKLVKEHKKIMFERTMFLPEHSIETQLPFLVQTLQRKDFRIVPILISGTQWEKYAKILAEALSKYYNEELLVVASTDLSHYPPYNIALQMDKEVIEKIINQDIEGYIKTVNETEDIVSCRLCGPAGVLTLLYLNKLLTGVSAELIKYENSGDVTEEKSQVVGYCGIIFYMKESKLIPAQKEYLLSTARQAIEGYIKQRKYIIPEKPPQDERLKSPKGVFVTINRNGELRGCIGYIQPVYPLYEAVARAAIEASRDPRFTFMPITKEELPLLNIEISVLSPLERIEDIEDIKVGKHGIYIVKGAYSGLLLPQVAIEHKWDRLKFLEETCYKAGLSKDAWKDKSTQIYIFSAEIFSEKTQETESP